MGMVYLAHDAQLDRPVALKILYRRSVEEDGALLAEARSLARVRHPNVVTVFDAALHRGRLCVVMEYVDGETLRAWVRSRPRTWKQILGVLSDAARGLAAAHAAGLTHGDFKPDNVLIGRDGRVQVTDFGLARPAGSGGDGQGALVGTPGVHGARAASQDVAPTRAATQFSFCVTAYEMLFGLRPFAGDDLAALRREMRRPPSFASELPLPRAWWCVRSRAASPPRQRRGTPRSTSCGSSSKVGRAADGSGRFRSGRWRWLPSSPAPRKLREDAAQPTLPRREPTGRGGVERAAPRHGRRGRARVLRSPLGHRACRRLRGCRRDRCHRPDHARALPRPVALLRRPAPAPRSGDDDRRSGLPGSCRSRRAVSRAETGGGRVFSCDLPRRSASKS